MPVTWSAWTFPSWQTGGPTWWSRSTAAGPVASSERQACGRVVLDPRASFGVVDCADVSAPVLLDNSRTTTRLRFTLPGQAVVVGPGETRSLRLHLPVSERVAVTVDDVLADGEPTERAVTSTARCAAAPSSEDGTSAGPGAGLDAGAAAREEAAAGAAAAAPEAAAGAAATPRKAAPAPPTRRAPPTGRTRRYGSRRRPRRRRDRPARRRRAGTDRLETPEGALWLNRHLLELSLRHTTVRAEPARRECGNSGATTHPFPMQKEGELVQLDFEDRPWGS